MRPEKEVARVSAEGYPEVGEAVQWLQCGQVGLGSSEKDGKTRHGFHDVEAEFGPRRSCDLCLPGAARPEHVLAEGPGTCLRGGRTDLSG